MAAAHQQRRGGRKLDHMRRVPPAAPEHAPVFTLGELDEAKAALAKGGVCIVRGAASAEELARGEALFWEFLAATGLGLDRADMSTFRNDVWHRLGFAASGVVTEFSVGHSDFLWHCRQLPGVRGIFEAIWGTKDLVTSFDGCGSARNPFLRAESEQFEDWRTKGGWYHVDQNGKYEPDLMTYQGLLNFFPATASTGSTVVVPGSKATYFPQLTADEARQKIPANKHHVRLNKGRDYAEYCQEAVQVVLEPGDFLLWDSRTIHCSQGMDEAATPAEALPGREDHPLARLVAYVCMIPRERLKRTKLPRLRRLYATQGMTASHRPDEELNQRAACKPLAGYKPPPKGDPRWELI